VAYIHRPRGVVVLLIAVLAGCSSRSPRAASERQKTTAAITSARENVGSESSGNAAPQVSNESYSRVEARHVIFHESSGIHLRAEWLSGRLYPTRKGTIPSLDDPKSFKVEVDEGKTEISLDDLSLVLRERVLRQSRLSGLHITAKGPREVVVSGTLHEVVPLPVQMTGEIGAAPDGRIDVHIKDLKILKIPFKGMLEAMRIDPARLVNASRGKGVQAKGDSVYLRTEELLPPPRKAGVLSSVHFTKGGELEEDYGDVRSENLSPADWDRSRWRNYIRVKGGTIQFGKLTMQSADLTLLDASPGDWFEFDLAHYREQIVSGEMRMTRTGGLRVFVPDITKMHLPQDMPRQHTASQ